MKNKELKIDELLKIQPGLSYRNGIVEGDININLHYNGYYVDNNYGIKIIVDYKSPFSSKVYETKGAIRGDYKHKYKDGTLCLSTPIDLKLAEANDCSLIAFFKKFIEPYFFFL